MPPSTAPAPVLSTGAGAAARAERSRTLDACLVAGDALLMSRLHQDAVAQWRREARRSLGQLRELTQDRWSSHGELAFLLEGDVKESRGGLRDFNGLRAIGFAGVADGPRP